jgi:heavy metal efflux system protein
VVLGLGFMLMGENSHDVVTRLLRERLEEIGAPLPEGVVLRRCTSAPISSAR